MNTSKIGNIGETKVLFEFTKLNIPCYIPYGDGNTCDLIADFNGRLNRIQVKTCSKLNSSGALEWKVTRQDGFHGNKQTYSKNDIDYFAFYCVETDIVCLIPFDNNFPTVTLTVRLDNYEGKRLSTMRFASDYSIQNIINQASE